GAAKAVASALISKIRTGEPVRENDGVGTCYIEFGGGRIGKVEVDFFSGPKPLGTYCAPSVGLRVDKENFRSSRRYSWFGIWGGEWKIDDLHQLRLRCSGGIFVLPECGARHPLRCMGCGFACAADFAFCPKCGQKLAATPEPIQEPRATVP